MNNEKKNIIKKRQSIAENKIARRRKRKSKKLSICGKTANEIEKMSN